MSLLANLRAIGRAPAEQHSPMIMLLLNNVKLSAVCRVARQHRADPLVGNMLLGLKTAYLNPPPHALEQLGAQAE